MPYLVQAFVPGETLHATLGAEGRLPPARAVRIADAVLDALDAAHHQGIVHRDIKPANVMLACDHRGREQVKLLDFGIAHVVGEARGDIAPTATGVIIGTPQYMAPEQFAGEAITARCDVYPVGVLLYQMLTGSTPFAGSTVALMQQHLNTPPPALPADVAPPAVAHAVTKALAKDPADRFADAAAFRAALEAAPDGSAAAPRRRWALVAASGLLVTTAFAAWPILRGPSIAEGRQKSVDAGVPRDARSMAASPADATQDDSTEPPPAVAPDAAALDDAPLDAAAPAEPRRPPPSSLRAPDPEPRLRAALAACDCAAAARLSAAWDAAEPMSAELRALYTDRCRVLGQGCLQGD